MTGNELADIIHGAGLSLAEVARLLRYAPASERDVRKMCDGGKDVPGPVAVIMELVRDGRIDDLVDAARRR